MSICGIIAAMSRARSTPHKISIVIPVYNERACLTSVYARLNEQLNASGYSFELLFVDDGSTDGGLDVLKLLAKNDKRVRVVVLSRNFGKEAALSAGLDYASGEAVIPFDADLQDPPEAIIEMLKAWRQGAQIVNAKRVDRGADGVLKRASARAFYTVMNFLSEVPLPHDVGDFRLLDRRVVDAIKCLPERRRFMKGLFAWVGFQTATVEYVRPRRSAGRSKFNGWKLWNLALEGITSFSTVPLRILMYFGLFVALSAFTYGAYLFVRTMIYGVDVPGYASIFLAVTIFGGLNMFGMGLMGEYIGRIFVETKGRPIYIVRDAF